jgi:hypothetical protein
LWGIVALWGILALSGCNVVEKIFGNMEQENIPTSETPSSFYVSDEGLDTNNGFTEVEAFKTLAAAYKAAAVLSITRGSVNAAGALSYNRPSLRCRMACVCPVTRLIQTTTEFIPQTVRSRCKAA